MRKYRRKNKNNAEKMLNTAAIIAYAIIGCIVGIAIVLNAYKFGEMNDVVKNIGALIVSISSGTAFLEMFGYVNYTRKRMCEILCEDEVIKVLDIERKKELKSALIKNIYMNNAPELQMEENNISTIMDEEMDNILQEYYFEECIMYIDVSVEKDKNGNQYFKKKIRQTFTAKTVNKQKCVLKSPISTYLKPPSDMEPLKITRFVINNEELDCSAWKLTSQSNNDELKNTYTNKYSMDEVIKQNKEKFTFTDRIDVDFEYYTLVYIDDNVYSYQIQNACKHFCIHINVPSEYKIIVEGFGFMSLGNNKKQRLIETENGCMLRFLDWILPGNGIMAVFQKR